MVASTVNPSDAVTVSGAYASRTTFPLVPGFEGVGVVEAAGEAVPPAARSLVGRRVLPLGGPGCWQQLRNVEYSWCVPVPDELTDRDACFSYINPLTASQMVARHCTGARTVLITAATSAIAGHLAEILTERATQPVRLVGLVRGTVGRTVADADRWTDIVSLADPGWRNRLRSGLGTGGAGGTGGTGSADVILDCVGGPLGRDLMDLLAPGGTLVLYGLLSGEPLPADCFGRDGTSVEMFRLRDVVHSHPRWKLPDLFDPVFDLLRAGFLHTPVAAQCSLDDLPGLLRSRGPTGHGKILIDPWG